MKNNNQTYLPESSLLNSLNLHTTLSTSFLTSTNNQESTVVDLLNDINRRRAIVPTPNRPTRTAQSITITDNDKKLTSELTKDNQNEFNDKSKPPIEISTHTDKHNTMTNSLLIHFLNIFPNYLIFD